MGAVTVGNATWSGGGTDGLGIQASSSDGSPFAFYIKNSNDDLLTSVRCDGDTNIKGNITITGTTTLNDNLTINTGDLKITGIGDTAGTPNVFITPEGVLYKSTTTFYSTEEVDKMLTIKDKLIEKLSARLDSLELKFKALK